MRLNKKKCKVVMLPTKDMTNLQLGLEGGYLYLNNTGYIDERTAYQHIHIVVIERLVVGDKVVFNDGVWTVIQSPEHEKNSDITYLIFNNGNMIGVHKDNLMKIIATTDKSLIIGVPQFIKGYLPQPSKTFIKEYVETYNANTPIVDVMVEYEQYDGTTSITKDWGGKLKVCSQNQITITKTKDSWSREEVIRLCNKAWLKTPNTSNMLEEFNNWVEQNL